MSRKKLTTPDAEVDDGGRRKLTTPDAGVDDGCRRKAGNGRCRKLCGGMTQVEESPQVGEPRRAAVYSLTWFTGDWRPLETRTTTLSR